MKTVLVVDDEQALGLALQLTLEGEGYRVLVAESGEEALLLVKDGKPDLIILDIMMPGLGGLETLKILRSHPAYTRLPVLMMSGARPFAKKADYGWDDIIYKPFQLNEMLTKIEGLVGSVR